MWYKIGTQLHSFAYGYPVFPISFIEKITLLYIKLSYYIIGYIIIIYMILFPRIALVFKGL